MLLPIQKFSQVGNPDYLKSQFSSQNCNLVPKIGVGDVIVSYTTTCTSNQSHMLNHLRWMSLYQKWSEMINVYLFIVFSFRCRKDQLAVLFLYMLLLCTDLYDQDYEGTAPRSGCY